ncbi:MAG TPA: hypothetical protein V6C97_06325 [Oculatellaceae cyanobacterium]
MPTPIQREQILSALCRKIGITYLKPVPEIEELASHYVPGDASSDSSMAADSKSNLILKAVSSKTHGFVAADLERLVRESVLAAVRRMMPAQQQESKELQQQVPGEGQSLPPGPISPQSSMVHSFFHFWRLI